MDDYTIEPFLHHIPQNITAQYQRTVNFYREIMDSVTEGQFEPATDISDTLQALSARFSGRFRNQIQGYLNNAHDYFERVLILLTNEHNAAPWFVREVQSLLSVTYQPDVLSMCYLHFGVRNIHQVLSLFVKDDVSRELVETANRHLHTPLSGYLRGIVDIVTSLTVVAPIAVASWQHLSHVWTQEPHYRGMSLPPHLRTGVALADLAYKEVDADVDGYIVRQIESANLTIGSTLLSGHFDLGDGLHGFIARRTHPNSDIVIGFRGTDSWRNVWTDIVQYCLCDDITYRKALGFVILASEQYPDKPIRVFGHSLGGGLTQFAVAVCDNPRVEGFGYNSAGLSFLTLSRMTQPHDRLHITHYHLRDDVVFNIGHHLGQQIHSACQFHTGIDIKAIKQVHSIDMLRTILCCNRYWKLSV